MAATIPTKEPLTIRAGDTIQWTKTLDDYPSKESFPHWLLHYSFRGTAGSFDILAVSAASVIDNAGATGPATDHLVNVSPKISTDYDAGIYDVLGYAQITAQGEVALGTYNQRHSVFTGRIEVLVDLETAGSSYDGRPHVKKTLDAIEAVLENRATKEIEESTIEGVMIKRIPHEELIKFRSKYLSWYRQEQAATTSRE